MRLTRALLSCSLVLSTCLGGQTIGTPTGELGEISPEELLSVQVSSVGRKAQRLAKAPAAVFVITQEDLRRAGVTTIAEALRMVPGLEVARLNANNWAISARGFNAQFANKMLVMVDGHSVYTTIYSGVFWELEDTMLEDIDRIEVIRGPGAVMWGANAVNGVINIITKKARDTEGALLSLKTGTEDRFGAGFRYGGRVNDRIAYRFFGKYDLRQVAPEGTPAIAKNLLTGMSFTPGFLPAMDWGTMRAGFRIDWDRSERDQFQLLGDIYQSAIDEVTYVPSLTSPYLQRLSGQDKPTGGFMLGRWTRAHSRSGESVVQVYYDFARRSDTVASFQTDTFDIDFQRRKLLSDRHEVFWGGGLRRTSNTFPQAGIITLRPEQRADLLYSGVLRDEFQFVQDRLLLSAGARLEHNAYSGVEFQPSLRLLYTPNSRRSLWAAWSRAVRTPARLDHDMTVNLATDGSGPLPILVQKTGNSGFGAEKVYAHEIGYRQLYRQKWSFDVTAFHNRYSDLIGNSPSEPIFSPIPVPHLVVDFQARNGIMAKVRGVEAWGNWQVTPRWRLMPGYSYLHTDFGLMPGKQALLGLPGEEGYNPRHHFNLRSWFELSRTWQFDGALYSVDKVRSTDIPAYSRIDLRLCWRPNRANEFSAGVQDLLDRRHIEGNGESFFIGTEVRRAFVVRWLRRF